MWIWSVRMEYLFLKINYIANTKEIFSVEEMETKNILLILNSIQDVIIKLQKIDYHFSSWFLSHLYHIISYYIILYHIILYHIILYYIILHYIISYYIISYYIILYYIKLYFYNMIFSCHYICRIIELTILSSWCFIILNFTMWYFTTLYYNLSCKIKHLLSCHLKLDLIILISLIVLETTFQSIIIFRWYLV